MINAEIIYPELTSDSLFTDKDVQVLKRVESFVRDGLIRTFALSCGARWKFSDKATNDLYFSLYALAKKGEISLGEYSMSFLNRTTQDGLNEKFRHETKRVGQIMQAKEKVA